MSRFYTNFNKILVLAVGVFCNVNYACCKYAHCDNVYDELYRGGAIAEFGWKPIKSTNIIILDNQSNIRATIFTLQFGDNAGKFGAYFNLLDGSKLRQWPFNNSIDAKEWVINKASTHGIELARS